MGDLCYHLRKTADWPQIQDPEAGSPRNATEGEILNRWGMRPVAVTDSGKGVRYGGPGPVEVGGVTVRPGDYLWDCVCDEEELDDLPGEKLVEGRQSQTVDGQEDAPEDSRFQRIRDRAPDLKDHVHEAVLYRDENGADLPARLNGMGVDRERRVEKARELAADPDDPVRRRVETLANVRQGDVVERRREPGGFAR